MYRVKQEFNYTSSYCLIDRPDDIVVERYVPPMGKDYWVIAVAGKTDMFGDQKLKDAALFRSEPDAGTANLGQTSMKAFTPKFLEKVTGQTDDDIYGGGRKTPPETGWSVGVGGKQGCCRMGTLTYM